MNHELFKFFSIQRQIFGVCDCCGEIFRLSDSNIYLEKKPVPDWMDKYEASEERIDKQEEKVNDQEAEVREKAREKGRLEAKKAAQKVDPIFHPNKFNPDDAKVMFHPVDFLIFNGMKNNEIKDLVLFDREVKSKENKDLQKSIENTVSKENYEFVTMQVSEDGEVEYK